MGLIDERSGAATPDFLELQEALPVIRRSTWDQVSEKRKKREATKRLREEAINGVAEDGTGMAGDEDVEYQERRRTEVESDMEDFRKKQQVYKYVSKYEECYMYVMIATGAIGVLNSIRISTHGSIGRREWRGQEGKGRI